MTGIHFKSNQNRKLMDILIASRHYDLSFSPEEDKAKEHRELTRTLGKITLADLRESTALRFVKFWRGKDLDFRDLALILRLMIDEEMRFSDVVPSEKFVTPVSELFISGHVHSGLKRGGFYWVELLTYITAQDLLRIPQFGKTYLSELQRALKLYGVNLAN